MTAGKPSTHSYLQSGDRQSDDETASGQKADSGGKTVQGQDIFHPDDPAVAESRMAAVVENTHVSSDLKLEKLSYVHEMLAELKNLAASIGEPMVSYLIDMALIETASALQIGQFKSELGWPED